MRYRKTSKRNPKPLPEWAKGLLDKSQYKIQHSHGAWWIFGPQGDIRRTFRNRTDAKAYLDSPQWQEDAQTTRNFYAMAPEIGDVADIELLTGERVQIPVVSKDDLLYVSHMTRRDGYYEASRGTDDKWARKKVGMSIPTRTQYDKIIATRQYQSNPARSTFRAAESAHRAYLSGRASKEETRAALRALPRVSRGEWLAHEAARGLHVKGHASKSPRDLRGSRLPNPRGDVRVTSSHIELDRYPESLMTLPLTPIGRRMYTGEDPRKSAFGYAMWMEPEYIPSAKEAHRRVAYWVAQLDDKAVRKALDALGVHYFTDREDADDLRSRLDGALYDRLMPFVEKKNPRRRR